MHFTAHANSHYSTTNTAIPFPTVLSDNNSGFTPGTGIVLIKASGEYHFSASLMKHPSYNLDAQIMWNDKPMCRMMSNEKNSKYLMLTCSATFRPQVGDQVFVRLMGGTIHIGIYSTFTGFLVTL